MTGPSHAAIVAAAVLNPTYLRKSLLDALLSSSNLSSFEKQIVWVCYVNENEFCIVF